MIKIPLNIGGNPVNGLELSNLDGYLLKIFITSNLNTLKSKYIIEFDLHSIGEMISLLLLPQEIALL